MTGIGVAVGLNARSGQPIASLRDSLDRIAEIGFDHAELSAKSLAVTIGGKLQPTRLATLKATLEGLPLGFTLHGTAISSARAGNLVDITTSSQRRVVEADLALATAIGATVLVQHSGQLRDFYGDDDALAAGIAAEREALKALGDDAARHGITVAVENIDPVGRYILRRGYGLRLDTLAEQILAVDHPNVGICLDVGHAFLAANYLGFDYLAAVRDIAPLVVHLHVSDNFGRTQLDHTTEPEDNLALGDGDIHLIPGWGAIPLSDVFQIPFPRKPLITLEIRAELAEHFPEALATMRSVVG